MIQLKLQTTEDLRKRISNRDGETKLGECVSTVSTLEGLSESDSTYVIFGICEDIGVQANYGKKGTAKAWDAFLNAFVNIQHQKNENNDLIILGYISVTPDEKITAQTPKEALGSIVERIDKKVADLVRRIVEAHKIPIVIGGGHNNAFGNLKGASQALGKAINAINIDAHTDFRKTDYRHSGNGFSYAIKNPKENYLGKYMVFGLHKNYTPHYIFEYMKREKERISYFLMEDMLLPQAQLDLFQKAIRVVHNESFGIELDCDSIAHFPSSAQTPSGFSLETVRSFMQSLGTSKNCVYLHICEAAPSKKNAAQVGKALTYLVTDFIHSHRDHTTL